MRGVPQALLTTRNRCRFGSRECPGGREVEEWRLDIQVWLAEALSHAFAPHQVERPVPQAGTGLGQRLFLVTDSAYVAQNHPVLLSETET